MHRRITSYHNHEILGFSFSDTLSKLRKSTQPILEKERAIYFSKQLKKLSTLSEIDDLINTILNEGFYPNSIILNQCIIKMNKLKLFDAMNRIYLIAVEKDVADAGTYNSMLSFFAKSSPNYFQEALEIFAEAKSRAAVDSVTYSTMILIYSKVIPIDVKTIIQLMDEAIASGRIDKYTFANFFHAISQSDDVNLFDRGLYYFNLAKKNGMADVYVYANMINLISRVELPNVKLALKLYFEISETLDEDFECPSLYFSTLQVLKKTYDHDINLINDLYQIAKTKKYLDASMCGVFFHCYLKVKDISLSLVLGILYDLPHSVDLTPKRISIAIRKTLWTDMGQVIELLDRATKDLLPEEKAEYYKILLLDLAHKQYSHTPWIARELLAIAERENFATLGMYETVLFSFLKVKSHGIVEFEHVLDRAEARQFFSSTLYNTCISMIAELPEPDVQRACDLLKRAKNSVDGYSYVDEHTYSALFSVMARSKNPKFTTARRYLKQAEASQCVDVEVYNSAMNVLIHSPEERTLDNVKKFFDSIKQKHGLTEVTYIIFLNYLNSCEPSEALFQEAKIILEEAQEHNLITTSRIYNIMINLVVQINHEQNEYLNELFKNKLIQDQLHHENNPNLIDLRYLTYYAAYFYVKYILEYKVDVNNRRLVFLYNKIPQGPAQEKVHPNMQAVLDAVNELGEGRVRYSDDRLGVVTVYIPLKQTHVETIEIKPATEIADELKPVDLQPPRVLKNNETQIHSYLCTLNGSNQNEMGSLYTSMTHGLLHGALSETADIVKDYLELKGVDKTQARVIGKLWYYGGIFMAKVVSHDAPISDVETALNTLYQSAIETGQIYLCDSALTFSAHMLDIAQQMLVLKYNRNCISTVTASSLLQWGVFAKNAMNQGVLPLIGTVTADKAIHKGFEIIRKQLGM